MKMTPEQVLQVAEIHEQKAKEAEALRLMYVEEHNLVMALAASLVRDEAVKDAKRYRNAVQSKIRRWFL